MTYLRIFPLFSIRHSARIKSADGEARTPTVFPPAGCKPAAFTSYATSAKGAAGSPFPAAFGKPNTGGWGAGKSEE